MNITQVCPWLDDQEQEAVHRALASNWITEGPFTAEFSARLNALMGAAYGVFAPNGTLALYLALVALGVGPGDEVIVPDTTFIASANAVIMAGATPIFAEVTAENYLIDVPACREYLTPRTRAIMPVHLFGMCADMDAVLAFAREHRLLVIEDAAQAIGVRYRGQHAGTLGDAGCFSFFADKTITTGEGGYVVCREPAVYERLMLLRNQGRLERGSFVHPAIGYNFRITDVQAAIGLAQLAKLDAIIARKREILRRYQSRLAGIDGLRFLTVQPGSEYVPFRVVLLCPEAKVLMAHLTQAGIQPRGFFYPLHLQPCFASLRSKPQDGEDARYAHAIYGYEHGVLLPVYPALTDEQVDAICASVREFYRGRRNDQDSPGTPETSAVDV